MITTNDPILADKLILLRNHGHRPKYYSKIIGGNFRMDAIQAAILRAKFKFLDEWIRARQSHAQTYIDLFHQSELSVGSLGEIPGNYEVLLPIVKPFGCHVFHLFVIRTNRRDELKTFLKDNNIATEIYYPLPLHLQECFSYLDYVPGVFPISEQAAKENLAIPIYPELTKEMLQAVVNTIQKFFR